MRKSCILLAWRGHLPRCDFSLDMAKSLYPHSRKFRAFPFTTFKSILSATDSTGVLYKPIEDVERIEYYRKRGYHPVSIGDRLNDRVRVIYKLGHGAFSTIWLACDERSSAYAAVKVCTGDTNPPENETNVLSNLSEPRLLLDIG